MPETSITTVHSLVRAKRYSEALGVLDALSNSGLTIESFQMYRSYIRNKLTSGKDTANTNRSTYCLCLNATTREAESIAELLSIWNWHAQADACKYKSVDLVIFIDTSSVAEEKTILHAIEVSNVRQLFNSVGVLSAEVPRKYNFYKREVDGSLDLNVAKYGYKSGPNYQFFYILKSLVSKGYRYSLLCETDCYPTSGRWLVEIFEEASRQDQFWVLGSPYRGTSKIDPSICLHINGVAVYATGFAAFADLLEKWEQVLLQLANRYPTIAYDWALDAYYDTLIKETPWDDLSISTLKEYVAFRENFRFSRRIINLAGEGERSGVGRYRLLSIKDTFPEASLVHGNYFRKEALEMIRAR
jgi:hypothetical protein